jgi:lysozyme
MRYVLTVVTAISILWNIKPNSMPIMEEYMQTSNEGIELIKDLEGLRLTAYDCPAGVCTIGYGHTRGVYSGMKITEEEAEKFLREDIKEAEQAIEKLVEIELTQNQYDALVSFIYNVGTNAFKNSTLLKKINNNQLSTVPYEFNRWVRSGGKFNRGLQNRRNREVALFQRRVDEGAGFS